MSNKQRSSSAKRQFLYERPIIIETVAINHKLECTMLDG